MPFRGGDFLVAAGNFQNFGILSRRPPGIIPIFFVGSQRAYPLSNIKLSGNFIENVIIFKLPLLAGIFREDRGDHFLPRDQNINKVSLTIDH
jgi:hypothetical protein